MQTRKYEVFAKAKYLEISPDPYRLTLVLFVYILYTDLID